MAQNKIQYQRGLPMLEFFELSRNMNDDAVERDWKL